MSIIKRAEWLCFAKLLRFKGLPGEEVHLIHSHSVCLRQSITSNVPRLRLRVLDLLLKPKRREGDPDIVGEHSERLIPASKEISNGKFYLSTPNIVFEPSDTGDSVGSTPFGTLLASSGFDSPYHQSLKSGSAALTSCAAQKVSHRLLEEQKAATDPDAGLHVFEPRKPGEEDIKLRPSPPTSTESPFLTSCVSLCGAPLAC
ncbi:hypothetical protein BDM02DRAFT_3191895 [Thelephora ganbajun]|uniref:Uncharacterized protein n=1 Tax=Thelephora ganbajun TaxID=370292 RepID=A0ACB6Z0S5_THEGA|nr:hypothetical protein BDM02DRAFT_3191895 [Thelephora ganbajun]